MQEGTNNHKLIAEARRIANITRMMGGAYTAGLLEAMAERMERET